MRAWLVSVLLSALAACGVASEPGIASEPSIASEPGVTSEPGTAQDPVAPGLRISVLELVPPDAVAIATRRQSFGFRFAIESVIEDGAGLAGGDGPAAPGPSLALRMYQGADRQGGKDAVSRLMELLEIGRGERDPENLTRTTLPIGRKDRLRLTLLRRFGANELWILERADGARVVIERRNH